MVEECKRLKAEDTTLKQAEAFKLCGASWKLMDDKARKPYTDQNEADKVRQDKQIKELDTKGFYTCLDGTKSTDKGNEHLFKKKKKKQAKTLGEADDDEEIPQIKKRTRKSKP